MRLTKQTSYALRILIHCALSGGKHVKAADIAAEHGITEFNVAKIVPILVRGGFITTSRGRTGGLKLARAPQEIGIGDVIRATEATHVEAECVGGTTLPCGIKRAAPINRMLGEAVEAFIEVLDKHTLADLIVARPREAACRAPEPCAGRARQAPPAIRRERAEAPAQAILFVENELSVPGDPEHVAAAIVADHHLPVAAEQGGGVNHRRVGRDGVAPRIADGRRCGSGRSSAVGIAVGSIAHLLTLIVRLAQRQAVISSPLSSRRPG